MPFTQDQNTQIARALGLIGANETAGNGLVAQRLQQNPNLINQYTTARQNAGDTGYNASPVKALTAAGVQTPPSTFTQQDNTNLARALGLISPTETAGNGLVAQRLQQDYAYDPTIINQYESSRRQMGDTGFVAQGVRNNVAQYAPLPVAPATYSQQAPQLVNDNFNSSFTNDVNQLTNQSAPQITPTQNSKNTISYPTQSMTAPQGLENLDPLQQRTNIASRGIYGGGVSPTDTSFFINSFLQNYLNKDNQPTGYTPTPVEDQYFQSLGIPLTDTTNPQDFLNALATYYSQGNYQA